ncbi:hypothetical protein V2605_03595 [Tenacibaculum maritimum]|uniref:hypothetical protein n=1 Tax=Tenacibaculum maritimum TaxID=107401 RepID=UPI0012E5D771|nr:hypothetical protein [Tenacibaculum maritimum]CAA0253788.1 conserved hypothetical protein [Tenacibaculum maritimum]
MQKEVNIHVQDDAQSLEVLHGEAMPRREPEKVIVKGLINAPYEYLLKRNDVIEHKKSHLIVNESSGIITLVIDEKAPYQDTISGSLKLNPDFEKFGINTGKTRDTFELADFIKMNRFFFSDKNVAMKLVSYLKNFKAKVNKQIEQSNNDRGNVRLLQNQVVESNIPEAFDVVLPIFKGQTEQKFRVEINIDARNFECSLISPDANDLINEVRSKLLGEQVDKIKTLIPDLAILDI